MRCRYCNIGLAPSRSIIHGEFCCDDHRQAYEAEGASSKPVAKPVATPVATAVREPVYDAIEKLRRRFSRPAPAAEPEVPVQYLEAEKASEMTREPEPEPEPVAAFEGLETEPLEMEPEPQQVVEAFSEEDASEQQVFEPEPEPEINPARETALSWRWITAAWNGAPRDLKLISVLLPVLLVVAVTGSVPKVPVHELTPQALSQAQVQVQKVVQEHWKNLNESISDRAAVAFADDFRSGLDAWESRSNLTRTWSYDAAGFVRPGPLALFKPTLDLTDYRMEFLGEIDQKAIGWAFRAEDLNNYYAMKFVVVKPGPLPLVHMVRYAVINGKEGPHVDKPLPITVRTDMLYRVQVDARGGDFTILAQGQVVDFWSDNRLQHGGVGFFENRGERARLRWVEVSHQYDALGRLCAYLAPYGLEGRNGNIN
jgi:hypothetical protein